MCSFHVYSIKNDTVGFVIVSCFYWCCLQENSALQSEQDINRKLMMYVQNCKKLTAPVNTIEKQIGIKEKKYAKLGKYSVI